jgi:hypothetical protein
MNAASKIRGSPAMLCERCKTEIALANLLDAEPDVNRCRRELVAGGERRMLSPSAWAPFETLYAGRGQPMSDDFLRKAIAASSLSKHLHQLRRGLCHVNSVERASSICAFPDMILDADYEPEPVESDGDEEPDDDLS